MTEFKFALNSYTKFIDEYMEPDLSFKEGGLDLETLYDFYRNSRFWSKKEIDYSLDNSFSYIYNAIGTIFTTENKQDTLKNYRDVDPKDKNGVNSKKEIGMVSGQKVYGYILGLPANLETTLLPEVYAKISKKIVTKDKKEIKEIDLNSARKVISEYDLRMFYKKTDNVVYVGETYDSFEDLTKDFQEDVAKKISKITKIKLYGLESYLV
jgi:hypothetical protein